MNINRILRTRHLYGKDGITGWGRTRFLKAINTGEFPKANVNLGTNDRPLHGWTTDIVIQWVECRRTD